MAWLNRCAWRATAGGTADFQVASAKTGFYVPAGCLNPAVVDGGTYHGFAISDDGTQHEEFDGVYTAGTFTRVTIRNSSNAGAKVPFSAAPTIYMGGPVANDMGAGSAIAIGSAVGGGTSKSALFVDSGGNLAQDNSKFNWDDTTGVLQVAQGLDFADNGFEGANSANVSIGGTVQFSFANTNDFTGWQSSNTIYAPSFTSPDGTSWTLGSTGFSGLKFNSTSTFAWSGSSSFGSIDVQFARDDTGLAAVSSTGGNPSGFRIYGSNADFLTLDAEITTPNTLRLISGTFSGGAKPIIAIDGFQKAGAPAASNIPDGTFALIKDTSGGTVSLCYNDGGTLKTVTLT